MSLVNLRGQNLGIPTLAVSPSPARETIQVAWPGSATGYALEQADALTSASGWQSVLQTPQLQNGRFVVTVTTAQKTRFFRLRRSQAVSSFRLASHAPVDGAAEVGVTFRPKITFSEPVNAGTLTNDTFFATAGGQTLEARIVPANDGSFAWLFFRGPMPGGSRVRVTVDGAGIFNTNNVPLDADGDGKPGGIRTFEFTTVSVTSLPKTSLSGIVVDPGPDTIPRTPDDVLPGVDGMVGTPDDIYRLPIQGVRVFLRGSEGQVLRTGADGRFRFDSVPAGNVKVVVDGTTAIGPPAGFYFPEMVIDAQMIAGMENVTMENGSEVYLPRLSQKILQPVNAFTTNLIKATVEGAQDLSAFQRNQLTIEIPPNSLVGTDGQKSFGGQVGISTVAPDVVRDMLPPGVLQHTFDITVQAPGIGNFSTPAPMTFPNVFNAAPGTKLNFLSFDHTTGRLVIEGTATVSEDGATVRTDPGTGITHPGWHGLTPPGSPNDPPEPPDDDCQPGLLDADDDSKPQGPRSLPADQSPAHVEGLQNYFFTKDDDSFTLTFGNTATPLPVVSRSICGPSSTGPKPLIVRLLITGNRGDNKFLDGFDPYVVRPLLIRAGQQKQIKVTLTPLLKNIKKVEMDRLYGAKLVVQAWVNPGELLIDRTVYIGRYVDATDADHRDGKLSMAPTAIGHHQFPAIVRSRVFQTRGVELAARIAVGSQDKPFFVSANTINFWPTERGAKTSATLEFVSPGNSVLGTMEVEGEPRLQEFHVDGAKIREVLASAAAGQISGVTAEQRTFLNAPGALDRIVQRTLQDVDGLLGPFASGVSRLSASSPGGVRVEVFRSEDADPPLPPEKATTLGRSGSLDFCSVETGVCYTPLLDGLVTGVHPITELLNLTPKISRAEAAFRLAQSMNMQAADSFQMFVDHFLTSRRRDSGIPYILSEDKLVLELVTTIVHELGHTVGLVHTYNADVARITRGCACARRPDGTPMPGYREDVMAQGEKNATPTFTISGPAFQVALGLEYLPADAMKAIGFFAASQRGARKERYGENLRVLENGFEDGDDRGPSLPVTDAPGSLLIHSGGEGTELVSLHEFGKVIADGAGGAAATHTFQLSNIGDKPVTIASTRLTGAGASAFVITGLGPGASIPGGESLAVTVTFDPTATGEAPATLEVTHDGIQGSAEIDLTGFGLSPGSDIRVNVPNNNVAGSYMSAPAKVTRNFGFITNIGSVELVITQVAAAEDTGTTFLPQGAAATASPASPIRLKPGEAISFDLAFQPVRAGLQRGQIRILSNDPDAPVYNVRVVGTGVSATGSSLDYGDDFVAMESPDFPNGPILRAKTDESGNFEFFLPPDQRYHYAIFDPVSGLIAHGLGITATSGRKTPIGVPVFLPSKAPDTDGDGLPDDVEFGIGSNPNRADTDGNGIDDFAEVMQGRNPLGGSLATTGIIGRLPGAGARNVALVSPDLNNPESLHAYVSDTEGLLIVDVSKPNLPTLVGRVPLGAVLDTAVDLKTGRALTCTSVNLAASSTGLFLVNISAPPSPEILKSFGFPATEVEAAEGYGYAGGLPHLTTNVVLRSMDLLKQELDGELKLPLPTIDHMTREANCLYVLGDRALCIVAVNGTTMTLRSTLRVPGAAGRMAVANGIAYLPSSVNGGYSTVDVSNPDQPRIIQLSQAPPGVATPGSLVAVNGSGLVLLGGGAGVVNPWVLDVMNGASPTNTYSFVTRFQLERSVPIGVSVGAGLAFVANDNNGLLIVNYASADTRGQAPTIDRVDLLPDTDANTAGVQLIEDSPFHVRVGLNDDVQVRSVELLMDGLVVQRSVSFPLNLTAVAPRRTQQKTTVTVQVRATDTGGNATLSAPVTADLVFDPVLPVLVQSDPEDGDIEPRGVRQARLLFSKPMAASAASAGNYALKSTAGDIFPISSGALRDGDRVVELNFGRLDAGRYQFVLHQNQIRDRVGNTLGTTDLIKQFQVDSYSIRWVRTNEGSWFHPTNWIPQRVPGPEDSVLIDIPSAVTPVHVVARPSWIQAGVQQDISVRFLDSNEPLRLGYINLHAEEYVRVNHNFNVDESGLTDTLWRAGSNTVVTAGGLLLLDNVRMAGDFVTKATNFGFGFRVHGPAMLDIRRSLTLDGSWRAEDTGDLVPRTVIRIPYTATLQGTGIIRHPNLAVGGKSLVTDADPFEEQITIGPQISLVGFPNIALAGQRTRLINQGRIIFEEPFDLQRREPRSVVSVAESSFSAGPMTNEFINAGSMIVRNGAEVWIQGSFNGRFINQGELRVTDRGLLAVMAWWVSPKTICDAAAIFQLGGPLISPPGQISEFSGPGIWMANRNAELASSRVLTLRTFGADSTLSTAAGAATVRLANGASMEGSVAFNDVVFEGELHNYNPNARPAQTERLTFGYQPTIVVRTNLTLNGSIIFHRQPADLIPGKMQWAGGLIGRSRHVLNGRGRIVFQAAGVPNELIADELTIGPDVTIEANGVIFGLPSFPSWSLHNMGAILVDSFGPGTRFDYPFLTNSGTLRLGSSVVLTNRFPFVQTATGRLVIAASGNQPAVSQGQFRSTVEMTLDGSFVLEPAPNFQASQGQIFELLTYQSRRGMFASHTAPPLPGGAAWIPEYASSAFRLRVGAGVQALALNSTDRNGFEPGGALALDGRDDYAEVPHADELNAFPLTVMAWVRTTRNTSEINGIISKQVISSATGYSLVLHEGRVRAWYFRDPSTSASPEGGLDGGFIADGSWHHIAFAVDQLGSVLFVDGVQKAEYGWNSVTPSDDGFGGPATTAATLIFGNLEGQANGFAGEIDEISLWNAFLSELEINYYKARRVDHADSSQIIGIWHFDEKSGNSAGDATDNGHAAVLKNGASWIDSPVPATTAP